MNSGPEREIAIFNGALQLPPEQRAAYLAMACGSEPSLRQRVEQLLMAHQEAGAFLEEARQRPAEPAPASPPPVRLKTMQVKPSATEKEGEMIGRYKVLQEIGEGGG